MSAYAAITFALPNYNTSTPAVNCLGYLFNMPFHTLYRSEAIISRLLAHNYAARRVLTIFKKILQASSMPSRVEASSSPAIGTAPPRGRRE